MKSLTDAVLKFRNERDWAQFHTLRHLIVSLNLEAAELLELTQWKSDAEIEALIAPEKTGHSAARSADTQSVAEAKDAAEIAAQRDALADECADVLLYLLLIADRAGIDLDRAARNKLRKNALKYPVELSRGSRRKYTELAALAASAEKTVSATPND
ncbi:nucleotide pyrophosphohydrolase [Rhodocyclus tenuis]|uniref:Nucleotide pyrophosphohydrolase n=1 Tax=Rhodocyclus gracilis TaxID=2929842 RepID=A0ABX0WDM5_9RHOO|nr:nucleotide pyrophosphohydrolase [Rhodocyclus gracilis]NJA87767.1 nucleotide pyrophosphohydrolase [Rhodocyclus gracilis]